MDRRRSNYCIWFFVAGILASLPENSQSADTKVIFDIPSKIECTDVTQPKCAAAHPTMKVIEAKFRISASFVDGTENSTVDFMYLISSPDLRLKVIDFLPNTTLESSTAEDRIEVTDSTESADATSGEVRVGYELLALTGSKNLSTKKTESNRYQRIAPKNLVLASGTVNRGHGVFYKLRPSNDGSLEGVKEFAVLCVVPKTWRGDWCTVTCSARANKKSTVSTTIMNAGIEHAHVGLFLAGDNEASALADSMTEVQLANGGLLAKQLAREALHMAEDLHAAHSNTSTKDPTNEWLFRVVKFKPSSKQTHLDASRKSLIHLETRFSELASPTTDAHRN